MQVFAALYTEGNTDLRFFESIVRRTMEEIALNCRGNIEIVVIPINNQREGRGFVEQTTNAAKYVHEHYSAHLLCIHTDADASIDDIVYTTKINPVLAIIEEYEPQDICRHIIPLVPIQMTEAWMLADTSLLKEEIGTELKDTDLNIQRDPESIANPKQVIANAITIARSRHTKKRRRDLTISELYQPMGERISLEKLANLSAYRKFREGLVYSFTRMNLL